MKIKQNLVSADKYAIKCPYSMRAELIVVHNTWNDASAENEIAYMIRNNNEVSFHYAVDDRQVVQGIPETRNAWHTGDGECGNGNRCGIGVEICYSRSGGKKFIAAEKNAAKFIAYKLNEKGWDISRVKKHQDFNGKYCPHRTLDMGWQRFLDMVQAELNLLTVKESDEAIHVANRYAKPTVKEWQKAAIADGYKFPKYGADGVWGAECDSVAAKAWVQKRVIYTNKNLTRIVQRIVGVEVDGLCGSDTDAAIKRYQKKNGLTADGIVGTATWKKMLGIK